MLKAILDRIALFRVEHKHLLEQAVRVGIGLREDLLHALLVAFRELADVLSGQVITNKAHVVTVWSAKHSNCSFDLIKVIVTRE